MFYLTFAAFAYEHLLGVVGSDSCKCPKPQGLQHQSVQYNYTYLYWNQTIHVDEKYIETERL